MIQVSPNKMTVHLILLDRSSFLRRLEGVVSVLAEYLIRLYLKDMCLGAEIT